MEPHPLVDRSSRRARSGRDEGGHSVHVMGPVRPLEREASCELTTVAELTAAGFTEAQAAGVLQGRAQAAAQKKPVRVPNDASHLQELRSVGFTPQELRDVGFSAQVLRGAGFTPGELKEAGVLLKGAGFSAAQLHDEGYSLRELKEAGFRPDQLRRETNATLPQLKGAGYTALQFKGDGFGPGELKDAGFVRHSSLEPSLAGPCAPCHAAV